MLKVVEPDYGELLKLAHRRWINERTGAAADAFDRALTLALNADRARRSHGQSQQEK